MCPFGMHHHDIGCFMHTIPLFHFVRFYAYHACWCHCWFSMHLCMLASMFMCLDLGYVCHAMCYYSPFVTLSFFLMILAYWFGLDLNPMVFVIVHTPQPTLKGLDHPYFSCLCLLASVLYACVSLPCSRLCHT